MPFMEHSNMLRINTTNNNDGTYEGLTIFISLDEENAANI
jgi:hypothetical protein